jgi:hypothetical protein
MTKVRRLYSLAVAREADATKGTAVAVTTGHFIGVEGGQIKPEVEYADNNSSVGRIEAGIESFVVQKSAVLEFSAPVKSNWIGHVLTGLLGTVVSANASGETLVREHTITVSNAAAAPSYTVFSLGGVAGEKAPYGTFKSLKLSCKAGELLMAEVSLLAKALVSGTGTAAFTTDYHFQSSHGSIKLASALSGLAAASAVKFHEMELTIERDVQPHFVFGSAEPDKFIPGSLKVSGSLTILHEAATYRDYFTGGTDMALRIAFQNPTTIGTAEKPELQIDLAKVQFKDHSLSDAPDDIVMETIGFEAKYDLDEGTPQMIACLLTNREAATAYTTPA